MTHPCATPELDAIIIGGGMIGLALAIGASQAGLSVVVVEPRLAEAPSLEPGVFAPRVSAINAFTQGWLTQLGVWQQLPTERLCAYRRMAVFDGLGQGSIDFDCEQIGHPQLGHIVENRWLLDALLRVASRQPRLDIRSGHRLADWQQQDGQVQVTLDDGTVLCAQALAGCDGRFSTLRDTSGIETRQWSYHHTAIVTSVRHKRPHQATARQWFLDTGPLALLPLNDSGDSHWSSIVWSADTDRAAALMALDDDAFKTALYQASEGSLGPFDRVDRRFSFPLTQMHAKTYFDDRLVLLGDAAHAIHPLAGQGANLGFQDAKALTEEWARARRCGISPGAGMVLRRYQRQRQTHNLAAMAAMDGFKRLFQSDWPPAVFARNLGLRQLNRHPLIKHPLMMAATGQWLP